MIRSGKINSGLLQSASGKNITVKPAGGQLPKDTVLKYANDSLAVSDSLKKNNIAKADTLSPIYQLPFFNYSTFINRKTINHLDYRYTGDLFKNFSFNYVRDYGFIGQPNETMLFGIGFNGISFFKNGILQNNRLTNSLDLNDIQSEYIDSIEIVPLPRGFLYGPVSSPVSVNFISRDFLTPKPYSRIKYYQGPDGEAFIDVIFNEHAFKKLNVSLDITNRKYDSSYTNSAFNQWAAKVKLKYFISDNINLIAGYDFLNSKVGLNGGVNYDSTLKLNPQYFSLYQTTAPVYNPFENLSSKYHHFNLRLLGKFIKNSYTDINLYYYYDQTDLNQKQNTVFYKAIDKNKVYGAALKENYAWDIFNLQLNSNFETGNLKYYSLSNSYLNYYPVKYSRYTLAVIASANLLDSTLIPSVYYKHTNNSGSSFYPELNGAYSGAGADLTYRYSNEIKFYAGFSNYKTSNNFYSVTDYEAGAKYMSNGFLAGIKYFKINNIVLPGTYGFINYEPYFKNLNGAGVNLNYNFWKVDLESTTSYYNVPGSPGDLYLLPKIKFTGGAYYKDILFHSNLHLKTGFIFYFNSKQKYLNNITVNENWDVDFTAVGEIQGVAFVYFTWQNLLNNQYYLIPYYPMPQRGIRFGISWVLFN